MCLFLPLSLFAQATETFSRLRDIKLLRVERQEVEALFGSKTTLMGSMWDEYVLSDGRITFHYSPGRCGKENRDGWDVPKGVLTRIFFEPGDDATPESLKIDLTGFRKYEVSDAPGQVSYENPKIGLDVGVLASGKVSIIELYPSTDLDERFSCTKNRR